MKRQFQPMKPYKYVLKFLPYLRVPMSFHYFHSLYCSINYPSSFFTCLFFPSKVGVFPSCFCFSYPALSQSTLVHNGWWQNKIKVLRLIRYFSTGEYFPHLQGFNYSVNINLVSWLLLLATETQRDSDLLFCYFLSLLS